MKPHLDVSRANTTTPAAFVFDTQNGTISAWAGGLTPPDQAVLAVANSPGAVYKGLVFGTNIHGAFLFAANFRAATIDVFAANGTAGFRPATPQEIDGDFTDPNIPVGFAPFGIQNINGDLFIAYAKSRTRKNTTMWRARAMVLWTFSTPTVIRCGASPAVGG